MGYDTRMTERKKSSGIRVRIPKAKIREFLTREKSQTIYQVVLESGRVMTFATSCSDIRIL